MKVVSRREDMSPRGYLKLIQQDDGDIIVACFSDNGNGVIDGQADVEFCTSGGKSPATLNALYDLMKAIESDNEHHPRGKVDE